MSSAPRQLAAFVAVVAALFGAGALAGRVVGADAPGGRADARPAAGAHRTGDADMGAMTTRGAAAHHMAADPVRGLAVAEHGLRLVVADPELRRGATQTLSFRIVDDRGRAVRDFDVEHTQRMHLIVARRDLSTFQHLHPTMAASGTWSTPLRLDDAGSYRLFADFSHDGTPTTLASDLRVDGAADLRPLPAPTTTAVSEGGYAVRLEAGDLRAGKEADLRFSVTRAGRPVHVEPYLGAGGHLVALREGDLAFLHVHPADHGHERSTGEAAAHDDGIGFAATFPTAGRYRLFLQFKHEGRVQTVAFTKEVG